MKFKDYTQEEKNRYISEAKELCEFISKKGLNPHLGFGTLLGAVREGKLIDGDYDIDICYLSKHTDKNAILEECILLYEELQEKGWLLKYWPLDYEPQDVNKEIVTPFGQAHIKLGEFIIDLFTTWIDDEGNYNTCQWGKLAKHSKFQNKKIENVSFKVPAYYNDVLTKLYGNWQTPSTDHPSRLIPRMAYLNIKSKKVTSIVLKRFHCTKQNREFIPKQHYISSLERYEEIIKKDKYLKLIKLE